MLSSLICRFIAVVARFGEYYAGLPPVGKVAIVLITMLIVGLATQHGLLPRLNNRRMYDGR
jgi:hypothetical protein